MFLSRDLCKVPTIETLELARIPGPAAFGAAKQEKTLA